jgi:Bacterial extracellular solute-binding proteins, family 3
MAIFKNSANRKNKIERGSNDSALYRACSVLYLIFAFSLPAQAESQAASAPIQIRIAFSEGDPPTSWATDKVTARGLLPELASAVFKRIDNIHLDSVPLPWPRAQRMAEKAQVDGLFTYPTKSRQENLLFSDKPTYVMDFNYVIFNVENPKTTKLANISSYEELSDYILATEGPQRSDSWKEENLPFDDFPRLHVNKAEQMFHLVLLRNSADYLIRNLEEAKYIANNLGYGEKLGYVKVRFKTQNVIPFHLGVQKSHPQAGYIIEQINEVQSSPEFKQEALKIIKQYQ